MRIAIAFLLLATPAFAQGYDDPRVAEYAATLAGIQDTQRQIVVHRQELCAKGASQFCAPMPFRPMPSVEEFRARLPK